MKKKQIFQKYFKKRKEGQYHPKYDFGLVLIIGGGEFYSGSPALSAMASMRTGADMVQVFAPQRAADIIASFSPDLAAYPLRGSWLTEEHVPDLLARTKAGERVSRGNICVVVGGGTGRSEETKKALRSYLSQIKVKTVVDADALHALGEEQEIVRDKDFLLTPHAYEFYKLTGREVKDLSHEEKQKAVQEEASRLGTTVLLKEKPDIISDGEEVVLTEVGSPYMSVGGTGDSLAGVCAALIARGASPLEAASLGTYILGKAGRTAAERLHDGLLATDIIETIPEIIKEHV